MDFSERRTSVAYITMEACTVNSVLFAQSLTSVPKSFDLDCRVLMQEVLLVSQASEIEFYRC